MSLAIVESLPCGVVSTRPCARDGRAPPPCSCPTATTPSRGRNVRGRPGGGPPADRAPAGWELGAQGAVTLDPRVPDHHKHSAAETANSALSADTDPAQRLSPRRPTARRPCPPPPRPRPRR